MATTNSIMEAPDRVRAQTAPQILAAIDREIDEQVRLYAVQPRSQITRRIQELDREWDIERVLETNASALAFGLLILGLTASKKWLLVAGGVLAFLFQHAIQGWCPPIPLLRRLGVRTRGEIDREKFALKFLRGDFESLSESKGDGKNNRIQDLLWAVRS